MPRIEKPLEYGDLVFVLDSCPLDRRIQNMYQFVMCPFSGNIYKYKFNGFKKNGEERQSNYKWNINYKGSKHYIDKCLKVKIVATYAVEILHPTQEKVDFKKAPQKVIDLLRLEGYEPYISE